MTANNEEIRKLAHEIWEAEDRPDGQSARHWEQATILAAKIDDDDDQRDLKKSIDPSEATGLTEPAQPDQT